MRVKVIVAEVIFALIWLIPTISAYTLSHTSGEMWVDYEGEWTKFDIDASSGVKVLPGSTDPVGGAVYWLYMSLNDDTYKATAYLQEYSQGKPDAENAVNIGIWDCTDLAGPIYGWLITSYGMTLIMGNRIVTGTVDAEVIKADTVMTDVSLSVGKTSYTDNSSGAWFGSDGKMHVGYDSDSFVKMDPTGSNMTFRVQHDSTHYLDYNGSSVKLVGGGIESSYLKLGSKTSASDTTNTGGYIDEDGDLCFGSSSSYMQWNGTDLTVIGEIKSDASAPQIVWNDTEWGSNGKARAISWDMGTVTAAGKTAVQTSDGVFRMALDGGDSTHGISPSWYISTGKADSKDSAVIWATGEASDHVTGSSSPGNYAMIDFWVGDLTSWLAMFKSWTTAFEDKIMFGDPSRASFKWLTASDTVQVRSCDGNFKNTAYGDLHGNLTDTSCYMEAKKNVTKAPKLSGSIKDAETIMFQLERPFKKDKDGKVIPAKMRPARFGFDADTLPEEIKDPEGDGYLPSAMFAYLIQQLQEMEARIEELEK